MSESKQAPPQMVLPWPTLVVSVLAIIGASTLAVMLIPKVSQAAAIRGGSIAALSLVFTQLGMRLIYARRQRRGRL